MSLLTYIFLAADAGRAGYFARAGNFRLVIRSIALLATFISLVLAVVMFCKFNADKADVFQFVQQLAWAPSAGHQLSRRGGRDQFGLDSDGRGGGVRRDLRLAPDQNREKEFYILLLLMGGGILGAFASLDLFFLYFFHELALVPTFIMIGVWGKGDNKNFATFQITLYLSVGALLVLLGLLALYLQLPLHDRTFDLEQLTHYFKAHPMLDGPQRLIFPLLFFGFVALNEYRAGTQNFTTVVTAEATALSDEQSALSTRAARLTATVNLIVALGGGWSTAELPAAPTP